jgi:hypothetical protein
VGNIPDVSEAHVASIFRVEVCKMCGFICIYKILFREATEWGLRENIGAPSGPIGIVEEGKLCRPVKSPGMQQKKSTGKWLSRAVTHNLKLSNIMLG